MERKTPSQDALLDAQRWFARLMAHDCTDSERLEFERWRAEADHAAAYAATQRLWDVSGKLAQHPAMEQLSQEALKQTGWDTRRLMYRPALAASLLLFLMVAGILLAMQQHRVTTFSEDTRRGERRVIHLIDGSVVTLNSQTELDIRFDRTGRHLILRKGEALFQVAPDSQRPFVVRAGDSEVTALGTRFQIRSDAERVAVTLMDGRVALDRRERSEHCELQPGEQVRFRLSERQLTRRMVDAEAMASWTSGRLRFRSTPLSEALDEVNRYSAIQIRIGDPSLASVPISGTFVVGDGDSVISGLEALLPIRAIRGRSGEGDEWVTLVSASTTPPAP